MLKITNFSKSYNAKDFAVKDLNLTVNPGEIVAFIGHNGAGKTTTLKAICGLINFDDGEILVDGVNIVTNPLKAKKLLAYLPDNPDIYDHLKGITFLNFVADAFGVSTAKRQEIITKYATLFNIITNLHEPIKTYSHGMKQKLAIISNLIHEPKLFLMDEPFVGLDPKSSHDFKLILKELTNNGAAILYSTHVLEVAEKLATHVAIIHKGQILKYGKINEILGNKSLENMFLELAEEKTENIDKGN